MSQANQGFWLTRLALADLSTHRYKAMKLGVGGVNIVTAGATDVVVGWLQNKPVSGKAASIACGFGAGGTVKAMAAAAIAEGAYVKVDNNGKLVTGGAGSDRNWGIALEAASADGDIIEILPTGLVVT